MEAYTYLVHLGPDLIKDLSIENLNCESKFFCSPKLLLWIHQFSCILISLMPN